MSTDAPNIAGRNRPVEDENRSAATAFAGGARYVASPANVSRPGLFASLPWTLPMIVVGFVTVAACVYLPLREESRRLIHELQSLQEQARYVQQQVAANKEFLQRIHTDPTLSNRLLMRMTNRPIEGTAFLEPVVERSFGSSPFEIVRIDAPPLPAEYRSDLPHVVVSLLADFRGRSVLLCAGLFLIAAAVILGSTKERTPSLE